MASIMVRSLKHDFELIADTHTGFLGAGLGVSKHSILNAPFKGLLRHVDLILLHNETNYVLIPPELRDKAVVLYDPFYVIRDIYEEVKCGCKRIIDGEYAVFPASWHPDEPIALLAKTWTDFSIPVKLVIAGKPKISILGKIRKYIEGTRNIVLTGYLSYKDYLCVLTKSTLIISASSSQLDMQASAYEALAFKKPVVASNILALKLILRDSASYFDIDNPRSLRDAIIDVLNDYKYYNSKIAILALRLENRIKKW